MCCSWNFPERNCQAHWETFGWWNHQTWSSKWNSYCLQVTNFEYWSSITLEQCLSFRLDNNLEMLVSKEYLADAECERKGKKLLFDSSTVERHRLSGNAELDAKEMYTETGDEWGYKYLQPPAKDVRMLSEMIFGGAAVTHPSPNMKLHHVDAASIMWSSVLQAPHPIRYKRIS